MRMILPILVAAIGAMMAAKAGGATPSFEDFDRRARAGQRLSVVFFGASLTWGANASDPQVTSYRGRFARRLEEAYPEAHLKFHDAAIGGTGSQLGVFRLERDVLAHKPDLVLLDFSANDDIYSDNPETLASYESLVRRIVLDGRAPVLPVIFPFRWNVERGDLGGMKRRDAHLAIAKAYGTVAGDAVALAVERTGRRKEDVARLWPVDGVHPGDEGYALFTDAAWSALEKAVKGKLVCAAPEKMLYASTYMKAARVRISALQPLPAGWRIGRPNVVSAYFDMLMSRWLDDEAIAERPANPARLKVRFSGSMVMLFGESTPKSGKFRALIDSKPVLPKADKNAPATDLWDAGTLARRLGGNTFLAPVLAEGLDDAAEHTLQIEPVFADPAEQELRIESICVAGGEAKVTVLP